MLVMIRAVTRLGAIAVQWPGCILLEDRACSWGLWYSVLWTFYLVCGESLPRKVQTEQKRNC